MPTTMMEALIKRMARRGISANRHAFSMRLLGCVLNAAAMAIAALKTRQRTVSRRRATADLTPEQLKDIGHADVPAPVLEVKAGLLTNLMSMR
jgi:hypothetical protein